MGAGTKIMGGALLVGFGALSGVLFNDYAHAPVIKEVELVTQSADVFGNTIDLIDKLGDSYLTTENSTLPLTYTIKKLEVVSQDNPDKTENIEKLIAETKAIRDSKDIMADPVLYRAALMGLKTDLSSYANTNRTIAEPVIGGLFAALALCGLGVIISDWHDY
jgi:hypothetical protein